MPAPSDSNQDSRPLLVAVVGPTASGKTSLALALAAELDGEIVNCDSMQMVRGLDIGTAKPTQAERAEVPHHLFDVVGPEEFYSAGRYMQDARRICRQISSRNRVPVVVGGTGLYLKAFLEGIFLGPGRHETLRRRLANMADRHGSPRLHRWLSHLDPPSSSRIQPGDRIRIIRALEVCLESGKPMSRQQEDRRPLEGFRIIRLALRPDRQQLYSRIELRVADMFEGGLLQEVQHLLGQGIDPECKGFEAIGYRQARALLEGRLSHAEAVEQTARETRRYAKRQLTWFRRERNLKWIDRFGHEPEALEQALEVVSRAG